MYLRGLYHPMQYVVVLITHIPFRGVYIRIECLSVKKEKYKILAVRDNAHSVDYSLLLWYIMSVTLHSMYADTVPVCTSFYVLICTSSVNAHIKK